MDFFLYLFRRFSKDLFIDFSQDSCADFSAFFLGFLQRFCPEVFRGWIIPNLKKTLEFLQGILLDSAVLLEFLPGSFQELFRRLGQGLFFLAFLLWYLSGGFLEGFSRGSFRAFSGILPEIHLDYACGISLALFKGFLPRFLQWFLNFL